MPKRIKDFFIKLYIRFCGRPGRLERAIAKARKLHKKTGKRYRVFFFGYRYYVWTREDIRLRIKKDLFRRELKAGDDFNHICFFDTNNPNAYVSNN